MSDEMIHVGWGLRAHPDAPCEWYLVPRVAPKPGSTGSNEPPCPPWVPIFCRRDDL